METIDRNLLLAHKLEKLREFWGKRVSPEDEELMERHIHYLRESGAMEGILKPGDQAPVFQLSNQRNEIISSTDLLNKGPLVVSFYRGSWCPYCVEEVKVLNNVYNQIRDAGADLVVISPQQFSRTEKQANEIQLQYNMLVDVDNKTGKAFGLVYEFPDYLKQLYMKRFGNDIQQINEGSAWELPVPARFVIGQNGIILDVKADADYRYRPEPLDTVALLKRL
ncbi:peroxiredoxin-like family protein [Chitinophaga silvisoli]|nr:peroxiredoxin-like family protein [Chitinophaga silvisoli]